MPIVCSLKTFVLNYDYMVAVSRGEHVHSRKKELKKLLEVNLVLFHSLSPSPTGTICIADAISGRIYAHLHQQRI